MKNKVMTLIIAGILTVGGISVAYAASRTDTTFNNFNKPMMGAQTSQTQSNDSFNNMVKIMKDNGFSDEAIAMQNRDSVAMNKLVTNISDKDYKKMTEKMDMHQWLK